MAYKCTNLSRKYCISKWFHPWCKDRIIHWPCCVWCVSLWTLGATDPASDVTQRVSSVDRLWSRLILSLWPVVSIWSLNTCCNISAVSVSQSHLHCRRPNVTPMWHQPSFDDLCPGDRHSTSQVYGNFWVALFYFFDWWGYCVTLSH